MPTDLRALDVESLEEAIYRWLVRSGLSSLSEIARGTRTPLAKVRAAVAGLERRSLATRAPGRPARFSASPPELAIEALIVEREQALNATRLEARRLQDDFRRASERRNPAELAEIVQGRDVVRERVDQLWRSAREEILVFDKPPYAIPPEENATENTMLTAGVSFKAVYSKESLDRPGALDLIQGFVESGEEARYFPSVPMKLNIFDRREALIPLAEEEGTVEGAIIVHSSHLLDALTVLWDTIWSRAYPLPLGEYLSDSPLPDAVPLSDEDARLASLLLAGSKSQSIARQMRIGLSTVERRIKRLLTLLGVESRVQLGYELARREFGDREAPGHTQPGG